jgi:VWFA-related protein
MNGLRLTTFLLSLLLSQQPALKVEVNLVNIFVTVQDEDGRFVDGLRAEDFRVLEDGREQAIEVFETQDDLTTGLGILVDNSGSSGAVLRSVRSGVPQFLRTSGPADDAFVMSFAIGLRLIHDFGDDAAGLPGALDNLRPFGTSVLFDALLSGIRKLRGTSHDRQALIVLTDGNDNRSNRSYSDVVRAAESNMVLLYFIGIGPPILVDSYTLEGLASKTGGRVVLLGREQSVPDALDEIRDDLGRQYYLGYHVSAEPGYHTIEVQVPSRSVDVRAREGYRVD